MPIALPPPMQRHWRTILWATFVLVFAVIVSIVKSWLYLTYALAALAAVVAFVYLIANARLGGRPSDLDEEEARRP